MIEEAYLPALHAVLAREQFGHREHLELAWRYLTTLPSPEAETAMAQAIRHIAASHGMPNRYHETVTLAWVRVVGAHTRGGHHSSFDGFIEQYPRLMERTLLEHHYSHSVLFSDEARRRFVAPDLLDLP